MDMLNYYKRYYQDGGTYTMEGAAQGMSRPWLLTQWLKAMTEPGGRILDVGCGDMYLSTLLPDRNWLGLDVNVDKAKGTAVTHDLMRVPYPIPVGQDAIVCSEVLEHVWDMRVIHTEAHRLLKPKGHYVISTPNFNWIENMVGNYQQILFDPERCWTIEHIRHYTPTVHIKHLTEAGFKIVDWTGLDAHCGVFFQNARNYLHSVLKNEGLIGFDEAKVDTMLGKMFPDISHTIAFLAQKE